MTLNISFSRQPSQETECAILCVYKDKGKSPSAQDFDQKLDGFVDHALSCVKSFSGKKGEVELVLLPKSAKYSYALLLGLGEEEELTPVDAEKLGGILYSALKKHHIETCTFFADNELRESTLLTIHMAVGMTLRSYDFDIYQSKKDEEKTSKSLQSAEFVLFEHEKAEIIFQRQYAAVQGTFLARDFVNEPPNILYPEAYAQRIQDELKPLGVKVDVLDEKKMAKLGMGALLAVGQGSDHAPRMVIMRWNGDQDSKSDPIAFVGKGVTFDTGGISLKPGAGMEEMKMDMGGSAAVVGLMKALALRKSKSNVVGIVGLVENMPSARSYRPADILSSTGNAKRALRHAKLLRHKFKYEKIEIQKHFFCKRHQKNVGKVVKTFRNSYRGLWDYVEIFLNAIKTWKLKL